MKRTTTLLVLALIGTTGLMEAQTLTKQHVSKAPKLATNALQCLPKPAKFTGLEPVEQAGPSVPTSLSMLRNLGTEEPGGRTTYDFPTNGCEQAQVYSWPNGDVSMGWTTAPSTQPESSGWPGRGTGVNYRSAWQANTIVESRIEASTRTGFSNYVVTANGVEHALAHRANGTGKYLIHHSYRTGGAGAWTETDVPTSTPNGIIWCKAAADGDNLHMIAITTPTGTFGGTIYRGMDGHVLYYRSTDGGATWDVTDGVIPGLDSLNYIGIGGDAYTITAKDGIVAVAVFESWADTKVFKSEDNGNTWTTHTALDFPFDKYVLDTPYTPEDIGGGSPDAPNADPYAIETNDEKGSLVIDAAGYVHCFFGRMWVRDSIFDDATSNYYPGTNGILYWSENDAENLYYLTGCLDLNGDNALNITNDNIDGTAYNLSALSSMPSAAADDEGGVYLVYSAHVENLTNPDDGKTYRHLYMMKSPDLGATWFEPIDVQYYTNTESDSALAKLTEAVYPSCEKYVKSGELRFEYQRDYIPGSAVRKTGTQDSEIADVMFFTDAAVVGLKTVTNNNTLEFGIAPNPTNNNALLSVTLPTAANTRIRIADLNGAVVREMLPGNLAAGQHALTLNTAELPNGVYFVQVQAGQAFGTRKLVVVK